MSERTVVGILASLLVASTIFMALRAAGAISINLWPMVGINVLGLLLALSDYFTIARRPRDA